MNIFVKNQFFEFVNLKNTGAAFSIFKDNNYLLAIFAILVLLFIICYIFKNYKSFKIIELQAYSFLIAGISSNTLERLLDGYVTDYIKLSFIDFPVFNLADIFINIGVVLLLISLLVFDKKENQNG